MVLPLFSCLEGDEVKMDPLCDDVNLSSRFAPQTSQKTVDTLVHPNPDVPVQFGRIYWNKFKSLTLQGENLTHLMSICACFLCIA